MLTRLLMIVSMVFLLTPIALAHGPTPKKIEKTITIEAAPEAVWAVLADFSNIGLWHPLVAECTGTGGNASGAERTVTLKGGGSITDGLDEYDAAARSYAYRLAKEDVEAFPVSFYTATIAVTPAGEGRSEVAWSGRFYRADTGNYPPEHLNDDAAIAAMTEFFETGLAGLKAAVEGHS